MFKFQLFKSNPKYFVIFSFLRFGYKNKSPHPISRKFEPLKLVLFFKKEVIFFELNSPSFVPILFIVANSYQFALSSWKFLKINCISLKK